VLLLSVTAGAAMFRMDTMVANNMSFAVRFVQKDPSLASLPVGSLRERIDGYFFEDYSKLPGVKTFIIERTLMMHL
jgi:hypothetical protein